MKRLLTMFLSLGTLVVGSSGLAAQDLESRIRSANEELLNQGNLGMVADFFLPRYINHAATGDVGGSELISDFVGGLREAFPDLRVEVEVLVTEDSTVAWVRTHRGTHQGEFMGVAGSGQTLVWQDMVVTRFEEGMIAEEWGASGLGAALLTQQ